MFRRFQIKRRLRVLGLILLAFLTLLEIVFLSPSSIEESAEIQTLIEPEALIPKKTGILAKGIPQNVIPEYSVDGFSYVSSKGTEKLWRMEAKKAFLYHEQKVVHSHDVLAYLYDPDEKITKVTGLEAKYLTNQRDLEVYGNVVAVFPDGFTLKSPYLRYLPAPREIEIPSRYRVHGMGEGKPTEPRIEFESNGLRYQMQVGEILLLGKVWFATEGKGIDPSPPRTTVESDKCVIDRNQQIAKFSMNSRGLDEKKFVVIKQPTLFSKARRAKLHYGDFSNLLQYLVANEDVFIKETGNVTNLRYATGGQAEFDAKQNTVILSEYPQAYQDHDTVVGDIIVFHRDSDVVEVEHSNAFSQGETETEDEVERK